MDVFFIKLFQRNIFWIPQTTIYICHGYIIKHIINESVFDLSENDRFMYLMSAASRSNMEAIEIFIGSKYQLSEKEKENMLNSIGDFYGQEITDLIRQC